LTESRVLLCDERRALETTFVPHAGMVCCSLRHRGEELLAQGSGVDAYAERGKTMGIPLLYPWANRLADFAYRVGGRTVPLPHDERRIALDAHDLPIHGVIPGALGWEVIAAPGSARQALSARLTWARSRQELFELFPFSHELEYDAQLADGRLSIQLTVHARGSEEVPVSFGFHPYLALPGVSRERWVIELPAMRRLQVDRDQIPVGSSEPFPAERFELGEREFDDGFAGVPQPARFAAAAGARRIELTFLEGYPYAQVFAPRNGQFICFEPMTAPTNALRSGAGLRVLAPGQSCRARFSVEIADIE